MVVTWVRRRWRRVRAARDRGFIAVEAVLIIPLAFALILFAVQFALIWHARHVASDAAQDGLHAASGYQAATADGQAAAEDQLAKVAPHLLTQTSVGVQRGTTTVTVHVRGRVESIVPFLSFTVDETATGAVENYQTHP